jgi:SAM-dependent methyltransferase
MRENLAQRTAGEDWKPPLYECGTSTRARLGFAVRRYFDLQAGSIWRDLSELMPSLYGTVADIGCGAQPYRPLLADATTYIGVDTPDAEEHFGYAVPDVRRLDGDRWPLADGEADAVLSTETLEHVPEPGTFLAEAARCLRPGGRLVLTVPFAARWHYVPHDYWRYTPASLKRLLEDAGFTDVVVWSRGNATTVACYKVMALLLPKALVPRPDGSVRISPLAAVVALPLAVLATIGNRSLRDEGAEDCLGYTVQARRDVA